MKLTAVGEDDGISGHEVETNTTNRETGEHNSCLGIVVKSLYSIVALIRLHATVDARVAHSLSFKLGLNNIEERCPLGEDNNLGSLLAHGCLENLHHRFGLGALRLSIKIVFLAGVFGRWFEKAALVEHVATHGTFVLYLDGAKDTVSAEHMLTSGNDRVIRVIVADSTFLLAFNIEPKGFLEKATILVVEGNYFMLVEKFENITDALFAESPVIATRLFSRCLDYYRCGHLHLSKAK